jgi:hypothetical protein
MLVWLGNQAPGHVGWGTCETSLHLFFEEEVAKLFGIPYAEVVVRFFCPPVFPITVSLLMPDPATGRVILLPYNLLYVRL